MIGTHTSWVEVNVGALKHNYSQVRDLVGRSVKIMAVIKADAYGHGAVGTAKALAGADYFGVTTLEEGLELRAAGISEPVLIFSPLLPDQVESAIDADLEQTVCDLESVDVIERAAKKLGKRARVHVKVDTGMGRLGIHPDDCPNVMYSLLQMNDLEIAGIYTHFANAGAEDLSHARKQNTIFAAVLACLRSKDIPTGLCHASNSSAILSMPEARYDMVRPGTILYGQYPTRHVPKNLDLQDTWCMKARITAVRKLPAGAKVGYGSEYTAKRPMTVAVVPVGFADGYTMMPESLVRRALSPIRMLAMFGPSSGPSVTIHGTRAQVVGRVSMQMSSVDVTGIPGVHIGDEAIIPARRVATSSRVPRVYIESE